MARGSNIHIYKFLFFSFPVDQRALFIAEFEISILNPRNVNWRNMCNEGYRE